ncbi:polysaccharide biosynthesis/export family protein [Azospirillum sp. 11R-A]|uniref:polysaccharide biosynthesis/export family protein n=1 Tax=Azospirillum sp. 11R-A TaxID=3111634 RepID=UPI003C17EC83
MAKSLIVHACRTFLLASFVALAGCASTIGEFPSETAPKKISNLTEGYRLEPGNRVRIIVFEEPNLSGDFSLDSVGNIALPLAGNIPASGLTARETGKRIEDVLRRNALLLNPSVSVEIQTFKPFYVMGEVRQPGEFPYTTGLTVLSAIARAGGYDYRARQSEVVLVRPQGEEQKLYRADEFTPIMPGDIVKVLERRY